MPVQTIIQVRRDTAANWLSQNPTLAAGEIGFETDTQVFKIGTGTTPWLNLPYQRTEANYILNYIDNGTASSNPDIVYDAGENGSTKTQWDYNINAGASVASF